MFYLYFRKSSWFEKETPLPNSSPSETEDASTHANLCGSPLLKNHEGSHSQQTSNCIGDWLHCLSTPGQSRNENASSNDNVPNATSRTPNVNVWPTFYNQLL